jgi:hypothetical protein
MDAPPSDPSAFANGLDNAGTDVPQGTPDLAGPAQTPQDEELYPPIASDLVRVLGSLPQRQENGYYVRATVLSWRTALETEIVCIALILITLSFIIQLI